VAEAVAVVVEAVVAEAVVAARSVAAAPEEVAEAVVAAAPEAVAEVVVAAVVAVAPVGRTTRPHLCAEARRPVGSGVSFNLARESFRLTNPTQQVSFGTARICAFAGSLQSVALRCEISFKSCAETLASGMVSNGLGWGDAWNSTQPAG
jgi:hypothetical protein